MRRSQRGFTLLEVIVAGGLFAFVTAAAMASYVAQVQLTNTQQQFTNATDEAREGMRLIGNDLRAAAPGINAALISGGSSNLCPIGTVPYAGGQGLATPFVNTTGPACLPAVFRSTSPLAPFGTIYPNNCGNTATPGYQLQVTPTQVEPNAGNYFCPDDLVILAVDDANSFFITGLPTSSLVVTPVTFLFMPPPTAPANDLSTRYDVDGVSALTTNPMVLISGASGPVLLSSGGALGAGPIVYTNPLYSSEMVSMGGTQWDMYGAVGTGTPVAMPARLVQYSIEPINATGGTAAPFVSANLVRTELTPIGAAPWFAANPASTVLVKGVLDMQVEFGLDPLGTGQLQYVNSGGYQTTSVVPPATTAATESPASHINSATCFGGGAALGLFGGTCFPSNDMQNIRSVRLNLLVRAGTINNSRSASGERSTAGVAPPFQLQPPVQDLATGNLEASSWGWPNPPFTANPPQPTLGFPTVDGAEYREVSTEIFIRNLGLSNNF